MYSDPMPGEEYENAEAREKARLEREAIANGENFNPNLTDEAAAGFENLGDDVPFAGDTDVAMTAAEIAVEGPAVAATDVAVSEGLKLVGDIMQDGEESQTPSEMAASISKKHDSDNAIATEFNKGWDNGQTPNLDAVQKSVEGNYINGAAEQSYNNPDATADIANTNRNSGERPDDTSAPVADQPHDLAEAAAIQAVSTAALSEELAEGIKTGNDDAIARANEVIARSDETNATADKIQSTVATNSEGDIEARMATDTAAQAREKAAEAVATIEQAQSEFNAMTEEEKAETQAAAEAAEANGTTIEEEKAKVEEEKKDNAEEDNWSPDLSRGIFS